MSEQSASIALVGHCVPDNYMLSSTVRRLIPGAQVVIINDGVTLREAAKTSPVWLVNRVLDGDFDWSGEDSGIELIRAWAASAQPPRMLLISNFAASQEKAIAAGAMPGFGKSELGLPHAKERVLAAIAG